MEEKILELDIKKTRYRLAGTDKYIEIDEGDFNFPVRFNEAYKNIEKYVDEVCKKKGVNDINDISKMEKIPTDEAAEIITEADNFIKNELNTAFGYDVSSTVFGMASAFSITEHTQEFYFENFMNAVAKVLEKVYNFRVKKMQARVNKYTAQKGKYE